MAIQSPPPIKLEKQTEKQILGALKSIKEQISESRKRESKASDIAADVLASGGGLFTAAKEALTFKKDKAVEKFKDKFDPLNIINRATGSKLATALAGRLMGRSEQSIRKSARLQQNISGLSLSSPELLNPTTIAQQSVTPTQITDEKSSRSLEIIAKTTAIIAKRVTDIATKMGATKRIQSEDGKFRDLESGKFVSKEFIQNEKDQTKFLENIWEGINKLSSLTEKEQDRSRDMMAEQKFEDDLAKRKLAPMKNSLEKPAESSKSWLRELFGVLTKGATSFIGMLGSNLMKVGGMIGGLLSAAITGLKSRLGAILSGALGIGIGGKLLSKATGVLDKVKGSAKGLVSGLVGAGAASKVAESIISKPVTPPVTPIPKPDLKSVGGVAEKLPKQSVDEVVKKIGPKVLGGVGKATLKSLPFIGAIAGGGFALKSLLEGDKTQALIDAGAGVASLTGVGGLAAIPATMAATLANEAYKEIYGIDPISDPDKDKRLPEIITSAQNFLKDQLAPVQQALSEDRVAPILQEAEGGVPETVSPMVPMAPTTGMDLNAAGENRNAFGLGLGIPSTSVVSPITNVNNNNVNNNTIHQKMPDARSSDTSFMRFIDRNFAPS